MGKLSAKVGARLRRKKHIRKKVHGNLSRPRLTVFRSARHISVQIIDDVGGVTVASASSVGFEFPEGSHGGNRDGAAVIGRLVAERAQAADVKKVVFDRNGFLYHGRLAALADAAREAGLDF
jgi:large subunit ribosomal protein L18